MAVFSFRRLLMPTKSDDARKSRLLLEKLIELLGGKSRKAIEDIKKRKKRDRKAVGLEG